MVSQPTSPIRTQTKKSTVRPSLERLEDRTLLSGNIYTVNLTTDNVKNTGQATGPLSGDLRYCIEQADLNPGSTIQFDANVFNAPKTISLSQGELDIADNMTITGLGSNIGGSITISGTDGKGGASRIFDISNSTAVVSISELTVTAGNGNVFYRRSPATRAATSSTPVP
jgi:hypothetical protein